MSWGFYRHFRVPVSLKLEWNKFLFILWEFPSDLCTFPYQESVCLRVLSQLQQNFNMFRSQNKGTRLLSLEFLLAKQVFYLHFRIHPHHAIKLIQENVAFIFFPLSVNVEQGNKICFNLLRPWLIFKYRPVLTLFCFLVVSRF